MHDGTCIGFFTGLIVFVNHINRKRGVIIPCFILAVAEIIVHIDPYLGDVRTVHFAEVCQYVCFCSVLLCIILIDNRFEEFQYGSFTTRFQGGIIGGQGVCYLFFFFISQGDCGKFICGDPGFFLIRSLQIPGFRIWDS